MSSNETSEYRNKVVLVTGSSSGMGQAVAILFASHGAKVVVTGRNAGRVKDTARMCREHSPQKLEPLTVIADLLKKDDCKRLIDSTIARYGVIDILVNSAGICIVANLEDPRVVEYHDTIFAINVKSRLWMCHLAIPYLIKSKGKIVNISSTDGRKPFVGFLSDGMANACSDTLTQVLALELGPKGVNCNGINTYVVDTPLYEAAGFTEDEKKEFLKFTSTICPLGRPAKSMDIANAIGFLCSRNAAYVNGVNLVVDGGCVLAQGPADAGH